MSIFLFVKAYYQSRSFCSTFTGDEKRVKIQTKFAADEAAFLSVDMGGIALVNIYATFIQP